MEKDFGDRLLLGVTAKKGVGWQEKLKEIKKYKIKKFALFIEEIHQEDRPKVYDTLSEMDIDKIPLVHIRDDTTIQEIEFLKKNYKTKFFTIHESNFSMLKDWNGFYKHLFLEMNYDNYVAKNVIIKKIGGFCIDISHFKAAEEKWSKDFLYVLKNSKYKKYFQCNHLNGYDYKKNSDKHIITNLKDFDYLKTIPKFIFGKSIALEMYNPIKEQIKYKKYLTKLLNRFNH